MSQLTLATQLPAHQEKVFVAAVPTYFPPYYQLDSNGKPTGFAIDIMNALANRVQIKIRYNRLDNWSDVFSEIKNGKADLIPNVGISQERRQYMDYTGSVETFRIVFFIRKESSDINSLNDLRNRPVGAVSSNIGLKTIQTIDSITKVQYSNIEQAIFALLAGQIDALAYPDAVGWWYLKGIKQENQVKVARINLLEVKRAIGIRKGNQELLGLLDEALKGFITSEEYKAIHLKWFSEPPQFWNTRRILLAVGSVFFLILLVSGIWRYKLLQDKLAAERKLFESDRRLDYVATNSPGIMFQLIKGLDGRYRFSYINQKITKSLGYDTAAIEYDADLLFRAVYKDDRPSFEESLTRSDRSGGKWSWHGRLASKDRQQVKWFKLSADIEQTTEQERMWNGLLVEVSDQLQAENQMELFFNFSIDMCSIANFEGYFIELNSAWYNTLGYTKDELMARPFIEFVHPEDRPATAEVSAILSETSNRVLDFKNRFRKKDGSYIWVSWQAYSISETGHIYAIARDITTLKNTEAEVLRYQDHLEDLVEQRTAELHSSEQRLAYLLASSPVVIYTCALSEGTPATFVSENIERVLGFTSEQCLDDPTFWISGLHPDDKERVLEGFNQLFIHGRHSHEYRFRKRDGNYIWIRDEILLLYDEGGEPKEFIGYWADITERKNIEAEVIEAKESAEQANRAKSEFLANMSHELRTPLHGILSFAQLGIENLQQGEQEELQLYLSQIDGSGKRLKCLLDDLLDISKLESGKMELHISPSDINRIIKECIAEQQALLLGKKIIIDYKSGELPMIDCDPQRIGQVVMNILSNAIKFTPAGSTICIYSSMVNSRDTDEIQNTMVRLSFSDQGPGIPEHELETIFDKFVQSRENEWSQTGTGLGLAISKELMIAHQGRIWAENGESIGAVFHFELPVN